jgi:hypothetical protein
MASSNEGMSSTAKYNLLESKVDSMQANIREIKDVLRGYYVTQDQFGPVRTVVYGLVGVIMIGVIGGLLALVLRR